MNTCSLSYRVLTILFLFFLGPGLNVAGLCANEMRRITGKVEDPSGAALPRVAVTIRDRDGKVAASTRTNGRGEFAVDLPEGSYTVEAELAGFVPLTGQSLEVSQSGAPLKLALKIPAIEQQIVITATKTEAPLSQIGNSVTVLTGEQLSLEGIATVEEALRRVAGLHLARSGGPGQLRNVSSRVER